MGWPERSARRNYLRVRGEYLHRLRETTTGQGTTSACAENTRLTQAVTNPIKNYLRVRGEYKR